MNHLVIIHVHHHVPSDGFLTPLSDFARGIDCVLRKDGTGNVQFRSLNSNVFCLPDVLLARMLLWCLASCGGIYNGKSS